MSHLENKSRYTEVISVDWNDILLKLPTQQFASHVPDSIKNLYHLKLLLCSIFFLFIWSFLHMIIFVIIITIPALHDNFHQNFSLSVVNFFSFNCFWGFSQSPLFCRCFLSSCSFSHCFNPTFVWAVYAAWQSNKVLHLDRALEREGGWGSHIVT